MAGGPQDIDWDRLDKKKFFVVGVGLFSGVTTALYPLSVIKTRQMAAHKDVSAGLSGTKQVAKQIWRQEGVRGFYRGFGTVVTGTIPARSVYMTTLEVTKAAVTRVGERFDISSPALAGAASFMGGAAASASTQAVVVPIDVISQRLMMQGVEGSSGNSSSSSRQATAQATAPPQPQQQQQPLASSQSTSTSSSSTSSSRPGLGGAPGAVPQQASHAAAASSPASQAPGSSRSFSSSSSSSLAKHASRVQQTLHQPAVLQQLHQTHHQQQQLQPQQQAFSSSCSTRQPPPRLLHMQQPYHSTIRQLSSAGAGVGAVPRMNGFAMARLIVQQEGVRGLYRGFWPSLATFVPNSALWWGAYGFWQRFLWEQLPHSLTQPGTNSNSSPSTGLVVGVQTTASVLSGCTASVLTNPLDLVKTRLQVAEPVNGKVPTWGALLRELLAEEGVRGLMRGVAPRMASSAMWGTAMVSVYEFLKRLCAQP